jgi:hypothetical protein
MSLTIATKYFRQEIHIVTGHEPIKGEALRPDLIHFECWGDNDQSIDSFMTGGPRRLISKRTSARHNLRRTKNREP